MDDTESKELDQQYELFRLWLLSPQARVNPHLGPEAMIEEAMWMAWKECYRHGVQRADKRKASPPKPDKATAAHGRDAI